MLTDLAVAAFVALLVFGAMHVPRVADAIGRVLRRGGAPAPPAGGSPGGGAAKHGE